MVRRPRTRLRLALAVAVVAVVAAGAAIVTVLSGDHPAAPLARGDRPAAPSLGGDAVYAVATTTSLLLLRGSGVADRLTADPEGTLWQAAFTADGRYAYARWSAGDGERYRILGIEVATGARVAADCPGCGPPVPVGGSTVAAVDTQGQVLRIDLDGTRAARVAYPISGTRRPVATGDSWLLDSYGEDLVLVDATPGAGTVYLVDADGVARELTSGMAGITGVASTATTAAGGPMIALAHSTASAAAPCSRPAVSLLDPTTGEVTRTVPGGAAPEDESSWFVEDLWWAGDGRLRAKVRRQGCGTGSSDPRRPVPTTSTWWRWDDPGWTGLPIYGNPRWLRPLDRRTQVLVDYAGRLLVQTADQSVRVEPPWLPVAASSIALPPDAAPDEAPRPPPGGPACTPEAFLTHAPGYLREPRVLAATCRDGYASVRFTDQAFADRPVQGMILAAAGIAWHPRAVGTSWDGGVRRRDLVHSQLDPDELLTRLPEAAAATPSRPPPDLTDLVGTWTEDPGWTVLDLLGELEIHPDGTAEVSYLEGEFEGPVEEHQVRLRFLAATRNSAVAEATASDDPRAPVGSYYYFEREADRMYLKHPFGHSGIMWVRS